MISARSSGSFTIESNVCRQPAFVSPHELVMLLTPWHFVHSCETASLPGRSGRSPAPPFLWPATGAIDQANIAAAASIPSEIFDMSPPQEDQWAEGKLCARIIALSVVVLLFSAMFRLLLCASFLLTAVGVSPAFAQQAPSMSFFVTSAGPGKGGNLGGLLGADR